jgi:hypothetical protein
VNAGDVSATAGSLTVTATAGDATVGAASAGGNASLTATGGVSAASVTAGNNATVSGASVNVAGNAAATAGALSVTSAAGNASVGGNATAGGNVTVSATGGDAVLGGNVTSANGDVSLSGTNVTFGGAAAQTVSATNGAVTVTGNAAKAAGALTLTGESVNAGDVSATAGSLTVTATAGDATVGGNATAGGNVTVSATGGDAVLGGDVLAGDDVTLAGNAIRLGGNVTGGGDAGDEIRLTGPVTLLGNSTWSAFDITVDGTIDGVAAGAQSLTLAAANRSILSGNVGQANRLGSFTINDGFTQLGTAAGGSFLLNADIFTLAPASRPAGFGVDLGSPGALIINTGAFTMAQGTKATVLGDFTINNGTGIARLSDVNTTGVFEVNAGQIVLVGRTASSALTALGGVEDAGLDFVSLGGFRFSVAPILEGIGSVLFASPNATGDIVGSLLEFPMLNLSDSELGSGVSGGVVEPDFASGGIYFDLVADGTSSNSSATATAALALQSLPEAEESVVALSSSERRRLSQLLGGIDVRMPNPGEMADIGAGNVVFGDQMRAEAGQISQLDRFEPRPSGAVRPLSAVAQRFSGSRVREMLALDSALAETPSAARRAALDAMRQAHEAGKPLADAARAAGSDEERRAMGRIARFIELGVQLGMSESERWRAGRAGVPFPQHQVDAEKPFLVPASQFDAEFWSVIGDSLRDA